LSTERQAIDEAAIARLVEELFPEAMGVWLFGSFAHGRSRADSDLDLAVLPDRDIDPNQLDRRAEALAELLSRDVDLVDLRRAGTVLRHEAVIGGRRIAARDPFTCDLFDTAVIAMLQRLNEGQREHLEDIARRGHVLA
jgi:predicted nucleotidyltransferase